jgi:hypothetical protein
MGSEALEGGAKNFRTLPTLYPTDNKTATDRFLDCRFTTELPPCGADHRDITSSLRAPKVGVGPAVGLDRTNNRKSGALNEPSKKILRFLTGNWIMDRDLTDAAMTLHY